MGTQLQLILYMNALLKNTGLLFGEGAARIEAKPGGIFYFHIDDPVLASDDVLNANEREAMLLKAFKMSGLAIADKEPLIGMDNNLQESGSSLVIPVSINKNGTFSKNSSIMDGESFEQLGIQVEGKIKEIGLRMTEGDIEANPLTKGNFSACNYCRYGGICRLDENAGG
jgi:ATP-dependent helicase/nuclease subunit B